MGELFFLLDPGEQGLGTMEREDVAAARLRIKPVGEPRFLAGGFIAERQGRPPIRQPERHTGHILGGLFFDTGEGHARRLGLDRADGFAVYEQGVIGFAGLEGKLANGDATGG